MEVNANGIPFVPQPRLATDTNSDGIGDIIDRDNDGNPDPADWLDFVDSPSARFHVGYRERGLEGNQPPFVAPPAPDVDYTYPDINNLFLAYRGTAIRDNRDTNGNTPAGKSTFEEVKVMIPSFFRPQYMKSALTTVPTTAAFPPTSTGSRPGMASMPIAATFPTQPADFDPTHGTSPVVLKTAPSSTATSRMTKLVPWDFRAASPSILIRTPTTPTIIPPSSAKWGSGPAPTPKSMNSTSIMMATASTKVFGSIWPTPFRNHLTARNTLSSTPLPSTTSTHFSI
ncbi:MAG UNVERIFIED_CONTAM: hypothetical protein LVR18_21055 [Planctomycetaceae bacterium]